jgi:hypothetical protein
MSFFKNLFPASNGAPRAPAVAARNQRHQEQREDQQGRRHAQAAHQSLQATTPQAQGGGGGMFDGLAVKSLDAAQESNQPNEPPRAESSDSNMFE